ncbi:MAG: cupin domain-containing protein [Spirochaetales bacterium]|nr:cupin domain-containing protein [Spirochaetales bacterium]
MPQIRGYARKEEAQGVEGPPGVTRRTLSYDEQSMLCHFHLRQGARVPVHHHPAVQNGYVVRGRVRFLRADGSSFLAEAGTGYVFGPEEPHGAEALEDTEVVDFFTPMRPEYLPAGQDPGRG